MQNLVFTQLSIPEVRQLLREEMADFFKTFQFQPTTEADEIGKGAQFAADITGKAVPTIYDLVHKRLIPHSKQGGDLYFSRNELQKWMIEDGKRKTQEEIAADAANFQTINSRNQTK